MSAPLMQANAEWNSRPADQRFSSLAELHAAVTRYRERAAEQRGVSFDALRVTVGETETGARVPMLGSVKNPDTRAEFTHFSFGQFARRLGAPAAYLRELPASLASANLNEGLRRYSPVTDAEARGGNTLLFARADDTTQHQADQAARLVTGNAYSPAASAARLSIRSVTSDAYCRIWNQDITRRLIHLTERAPEWQPAPAAFDGSRGLYASEKDMFVFMVDNDRRIFEKDPNGGFSRGFFASNSEVGDASFRITTFLYQYVCGNHMVWSASGVREIRIPHIGNADARAFGKLTLELRRYAESTATGEEHKIEQMRRVTLGATKDEVLDRLFRVDGITKAVAKQAVELADRREDWYGNPRSVFGQVSALTEIARDKANADDRVALERVAGKVAQIAFA